MNLNDLGYKDSLKAFGIKNKLDSFEIGRVILEHKERFIIKTASHEFDAALLGNLRFAAESRLDLPFVGDWVAFSEYDENKALIHAVYPRTSVLKRKAISRSKQVQVIATNIDYGLIVQAVDRDFNLNRLERYLTVCNTSNVEPLIVLSKKDLIPDASLQLIIDQIKLRIKGVSIVSISYELQGCEKLKNYLQKGKTFCLLGSSGVGKSTLINSLAGETIMETSHISSSVNKGRHTTSHRELIVLDKLGILIDNPGMREVGIADSDKGLETTFQSIIEAANDCKFRDCSHVNEDGCAIMEGLENGNIDEASYLNFRKMEKEKLHFESDLSERKRKDKELGKLIKSAVKKRKRDKF